ncbi:unnamed protein product [Peronospora destructor]|uniref:Transmembrane protein n=1 Tax=Peronospora destructor TaxID=86335 RepID=A0AAV0TW63_9STRA|nr:unnamed protein product [Peronospora destructor]
MCYRLWFLTSLAVIPALVFAIDNTLYSGHSTPYTLGVFTADECLECETEDLGLSPTVLQHLNGDSPGNNITWQFIDCPVRGNIDKNENQHQDVTMLDLGYYFLLKGRSNVDVSAVDIELISISGEKLSLAAIKPLLVAPVVLTALGSIVAGAFAYATKRKKLAEERNSVIGPFSTSAVLRFSVTPSPRSKLTKVMKNAGNASTNL